MAAVHVLLNKVARREEEGAAAAAADERSLGTFANERNGAANAREGTKGKRGVVRHLCGFAEIMGRESIEREGYCSTTQTQQTISKIAFITQSAAYANFKGLLILDHVETWLHHRG